MNIKNTIHKLSVKHHIILEIFLCLIIIYLLVRSLSDVKIDPHAFPKNNIVNLSLLKDGTIVETDNNGLVLSTTTSENNSGNNDPLEQFHSIAIAIVRVTEKNIHNNVLSEIVDSFFKPAIATQHQLPGHEYYQETKWIDGRRVCRRYDITLDWKRVRPCV